MRPKVSMVLSMAARRSSAFPASHRMASALPPRDSTRAAVSPMVPGKGVTSRGWTEREVTTMSYPCSARWAHNALPMPRLAPVINATLPMKETPLPVTRIR